MLILQLQLPHPSEMNWMGGGLRRERSLVAKKERTDKFAARRLLATASSQLDAAPVMRARSGGTRQAVTLELPRPKDASRDISLDLSDVARPLLPPRAPGLAGKRVRDVGGSKGSEVSVIKGRRPPGGLRVVTGTK